jgi:hypothetical protein
MDDRDLAGMFDSFEDIPEDIKKIMAADFVKRELDDLMQELISFTYSNNKVFSASGGVVIEGTEYRYHVMSVLVPTEEYITVTEEG